MATRKRKPQSQIDAEVSSGVTLKRDLYAQAGRAPRIRTIDELRAELRAAQADEDSDFVKQIVHAEKERRLKAEAEALAAARASEKRTHAKSSKPGRQDTRKARYRDNSDRIEEFEVALLKHGIDFDEVERGAKQYEAGTRTPMAKLSHAVLDWWCSAAISHMRIVWVDPASGYTERTIPKLSSIEGKDLVGRGLAGGVWVSTRKQLLEARKWKKRMLAMTPLQRLTEPLVFGDIRLGDAE